jgi:hypothetical protein
MIRQECDICKQLCKCRPMEIRLARERLTFRGIEWDILTVATPWSGPTASLQDICPECSHEFQKAWHESKKR